MPKLKSPFAKPEKKDPAKSLQNYLVELEENYPDYLILISRNRRGWICVIQDDVLGTIKATSEEARPNLYDALGAALDNCIPF